MQIKNRLKSLTQNSNKVYMHSQQHLQDYIGEVNFVAMDITAGPQAEICQIIEDKVLKLQL